LSSLIVRNCTSHISPRMIVEEKKFMLLDNYADA
jgi:hypothetical protein